MLSPPCAGSAERRRMLAALLLSVFIHVALLGLPLADRQLRSPLPAPRALAVTLAAAPLHAPAVRRHTRPSGTVDAARRPASSEIAPRAQTGDTEPTIDVDAALAMARNSARENSDGIFLGERAAKRLAGESPDPSHSRLITDGVVERHDASGWVVRFGDRECVVPEPDPPGSMQGLSASRPMRCHVIGL